MLSVFLLLKSFKIGSVILSKMFGTTKYSFQKQDFYRHAPMLNTLQLPSQLACFCILEHIHVFW